MKAVKIMVNGMKFHISNLILIIDKLIIMIIHKFIDLLPLIELFNKKF